MPGPNFVLDKGFQPTAAVPQFTAVVAVTANKEQCAPATVLGSRILGICQENITTANAAVGRVADIRLMGISRCIAGAVLAVDTPVRVDASGRVVSLAATTANQNQVGITRTASTAIGDHIDVQLTPGVQIST